MPINAAAHHAKHLANAIREGRGYSFEVVPGVDLSVVPGFIVDGLPVGALLICQPGRASILLEDPSHFNKFVFVKAGFSSEVGEFATSLIRSLAATSTGSEHPLMIERKDT